ncbi:MAG: hypothetical protein P8N02_02340 [Actinomycetota bacterium]|nr:hypothetical protein [Actinomycetota bacterium]
MLDTTTGLVSDGRGDPELWVQRTPVGWSPDGSTMYFAQGPDDNARVIVRTTDDGGLETVVDGIAGPGSPDVDRFNRKLAYIASPEGEFDVFIRELDTGNTMQLTTNPDRDTSPVFSPEGSSIAVRVRSNGNFDIWIMNADGSDQRPLTTHPGDDEYPTWSSNGELIAFHSNRHGAVSTVTAGESRSEQSNLSGAVPGRSATRRSPRVR